jgi:hypothetical protein
VNVEAVWKGDEWLEVEPAQYKELEYAIAERIRINI